MKAFIYDSKDKVSAMSFLNSSSIPKNPGANNVLVSVRAASINPVDHKKPEIASFMAWIFDGKPVAQVPSVNFNF